MDYVEFYKMAKDENSKGDLPAKITAQHTLAEDHFK
jgi:hypothetical protein